MHHIALLILIVKHCWDKFLFLKPNTKIKNQNICFYKRYRCTKFSVFQLGSQTRILCDEKCNTKFQKTTKLAARAQIHELSYRPNVLSTKCRIEPYRYLEAVINVYYAKNIYSQASYKLVSCFRQSSKDNILQPWIPRYDFRKDNFSI